MPPANAAPLKLSWAAKASAAAGKRSRPLPTYRPIVRGSRWSTYRLWTPIEDAYLRGLWGDPARRGRRAELAALVLGRSRTAVAWHAHRLGLGQRRSEVS